MSEIKKRRKATTPTPKEQILGVEPKVESNNYIDYEAETIRYRVTNLKIENLTPSIFNGTLIETFIGCQNEKARNELIAGAKSVITFDGDGKEEYKIEVI